MNSLHRASAFLFSGCGIIMIILVVLAKRGMISVTGGFLAIIDLPLLFIAMLYGGSSLYTSLSRGKNSPILMAIIFVPLSLLFLFFCWLNFAYTISELI